MKSEMKRKLPPYNPPIRKAKGKAKNPDRVVSGESARACVRTRDPYRNRAIETALEEALREFHGSRGKEGEICDENIWGNFMRSFGVAPFLEAVHEARSEIRQKSRSPPAAIYPRILQRCLNRFWYR